MGEFRRGTLLATFALLVAPSSVRAQGAPVPLTKNDYNLELSQGPVTTASRIVGLGGAYAAMAEWCEGEYANAASPAVRAPYSLSSFDYDVCLGLMAPGAFGGTDFENRGTAYPFDPAGSRFNSSLNVNLGLQLQFGRFGFTVNYDFQTFGVEDVSVATLTRRPSTFSYRIDRVTGSAGWALFGGQFLLGAGARAIILGGASGATTAAGGVQVGGLFRPNHAPFRVGVTYRHTVRIDNPEGSPEERLPDGTFVADGRVLPMSVIVPLELEAGVAFDFGPRLLNPEWIDPDDLEAPRRREVWEARLARSVAMTDQIARAPEREREALRWRLTDQENARVDEEERELSRRRAAEAKALEQRSRLWPRTGVTLLASVVVIGSTPNAVGISSFLLQKREPYGSFVTASPRFGFETEVIPHWVTARGGTYLEPSRYEGGTARAHITGGADIATIPFTAWGLFAGNPWRFRLAVDGARGYSNFAIAIGQYH